MGCLASKQGALPVKSAFDSSEALRGDPEDNEKDSGRRPRSFALKVRVLPKYSEGEQAAAGWPAWLTAVAGEAIHGLVPVKADSYEKLEKIGQGTYSSVFRALDLGTGLMVALKKVRFDIFDSRSVKFMAREILILRKLDHPNIIKLEGVIASKSSCSIYLVFEYMEHDLTGLSSSSDVNFSVPQIKCYMRQLLLALEHCHSRGIMHRDIKGSNLLLNNEGILKVADFGLANLCRQGQKNNLTSRVVTLWYRPPELLLGSINYGVSVDLWSVGCVFAELLLRKPLLQGRTEIEQLHKIFKLCGSPPEEFWKKLKPPLASLFKPQQHYESNLREICKDFPEAAIALVETFLSVEPYKRGTASSALKSEYFKTEPYACDPSTLPTYPPSKEMDAKTCEEARRKRISGRFHGLEGVKSRKNKLSREEKDFSRFVLQEQKLLDTKIACGEKPKGLSNPRKTSTNTLEETSHVKHNSLGDLPFSGPLVPTSTGFTWMKKHKDANSVIKPPSRAASKSLVSDTLSSSLILQRHKLCNEGELIDFKGSDTNELIKTALMRKWGSFERHDSFDVIDMLHSREFKLGLQSDEFLDGRSVVGYNDETSVEFSGSLSLKSEAQ